VGAREHRLGRYPVTIADPIVLPADVVLVPVEELPPETRGQLDHEPGDFALTRPRTRTMSSIVDGTTASLLERFRVPRTIVEAIVEYARAKELDPNDTLEQAFPMLARFLNEGMLVPADSELAEPIGATLAAGERVGGFTLVEPVHVIDDTEVHLARAADGSLAALKIARAGSVRELRYLFDHEAHVLGALSGAVNPRLLERGAADGREFLAVSWCPGVDLLEAAAELRDTHDVDGLLALAGRVLDAYAQLHSEGFLHGDVHPRNVLVDAAGRIWLIDFGLAASRNAPPVIPRGGIDLFLEPELARARLAHVDPPALSAAGEQYSVAALVYLLVTGAHTHVFALEQEQMLRQLADEPPLRFAAHRARDLGAVEETLGRALAKEPSARYPSVEAFRDAFREVSAAQRHRRRPVLRRESESVLADVLERLRGPLLDAALEAPTASVNLGAAGLAYGVLKIAMAHDDPMLLALAERWSHRAGVAAGTRAGFENAEL
jgi:eukaryotic-like serine/threonine-protein kinase